MLVLSRKTGESLVIGDGITIVVSRISGNRVTLAIEAPPEIRILRGELAEAVDSFGPEEDRRSAGPLMALDVDPPDLPFPGGKVR